MSTMETVIAIIPVGLLLRKRFRATRLFEEFTENLPISLAVRTGKRLP